MVWFALRPWRSKCSSGQVDWKMFILHTTLEGFWVDTMPMSAWVRSKKEQTSILKDQQEVKQLWIRTHQQPEKGGMLHM